MQYASVLMLAAFLATGQASSQQVHQPISILGISWNLTEEQMTTVLQESHGFECVIVDDDLLGSYTVCKKGMALVELLIRFGRVEFNCLAYQGCDLSQQQNIEKMVNDHLVKEMIPHGKDYFDGTEYCGEGLLGDLLCIDSVNHIVLSKGGYKAPLNLLDQ